VLILFKIVSSLCFLANISFKMHFSKVIPAAVAFAVGSIAQLNPEYTLHVNTTYLSAAPALQTSFVSYANSSIWIGNIHLQTYSEPFSVRGLFTFTSYHEVATGEQALFIFPNETQPIQFTVPHGGAVPENATTSGFAFDSVDGHLTWEGANNFWGCENVEESMLETYQIMWFGDGEPNGLSCVGPLDLYADFSCSTGD